MLDRVMLAKKPSFSIGIEEEYLLVDRDNRDLASDPPSELFDECVSRCGDRIGHEFLRAQIEVGTPVCHSFAELSQNLRNLRSTVAEVSAQYNLAPIAAASHPFASWEKQNTTPDSRYTSLERELQGVGRRLLTCGMHVHIGVDEPDQRIDLMHQVAYFLPHMLALSTSSPFWNGLNTGLMSYRLSVFDGLPRTGLPEYFDSFTHYERFVDTLVGTKLIEDGSKLWWDLRPSTRYPTLEMRITDVCTDMDDGLAIAAFYLCLVRMLGRLRRANQRWRIYRQALIAENRWRAQRYGITEGMVDFGKRRVVDWQELLEEISNLVQEDAQALQCEREIAHLQTIVKRGTSATRQLRVYNENLQNGACTTTALHAVVDDLITSTQTGCEAQKPVV